MKNLAKTEAQRQKKSIDLIRAAIETQTSEVKRVRNAMATSGLASPTSCLYPQTSPETPLRNHSSQTDLQSLG